MSYSLVKVYAPIQSEGVQQTLFMECLHASLDNLNITTVIMGGDFNAQLQFLNNQNEGDNQSCARPLPSHGVNYADKVQALLDQYELSDAWRYVHPHKKEARFIGVITVPIWTIGLYQTTC